MNEFWHGYLMGGMTVAAFVGCCITGRLFSQIRSHKKAIKLKTKHYYYRPLKRFEEPEL